MHDAPGMPQQRGTQGSTSAHSNDSAGSESAHPDSAGASTVVSEFRPAAGLSNPHLQTIVGALHSARPKIAGTIQRRLGFADGDVAVMHDDKPKDWSRGDHVVLLMHGMAGCHKSGYMVRTAARLLQKNARVFRMDHRGSGAGRLLAKHPYHAGRTRDLEFAIRMLERLCPGSPVSVAGFSLSGNLLLRYLGENPETLPLSLFRAVAVCPPIDLQHCVEKLGTTTMGQRYDWYFARQLINHIVDTPLWRDELPIAKVKRLPRRIIDFDELYTAPASGFESTEHYYAEASAMKHLSAVRVHTSVLVAEDDPLVSAEPWQSAELTDNISLHTTKHGGHLGFLGRRSVDPDNRWMDWRVVEWLLN